MLPLNHYEVLGIPLYADTDEIKRAYRRRVREVHPDVGGTDAQFVQVRTAYEVLSNPLTRREYDENLRKSTNQKNTQEPVGQPSGNDQSHTENKGSTEGNSKKKPQGGSPDASTNHQQAQQNSVKSERREPHQWVKAVKYAAIGLVLFGLMNLFSVIYQSRQEAESVAKPMTTAMATDNPTIKLSGKPTESSVSFAPSPSSPSVEVTLAPTGTEVATPKKDNAKMENTMATKPTPNPTQPITKQLANSREGYFTIGSTKDEVRIVMGKPDSIQKLYSGELWSYGFDSITFSNAEKVVTYSNISGQLKVWLSDRKKMDLHLA